METTIIPSAPVDSIWDQISHLSDALKIQLMNRIYASLSHKEKKTAEVSQSFSSLKGVLKTDTDKSDRELLDEYLSEKYGL